MKSLIMSAPMVRALLDGRKTQTRRVMRTQPSADWSPESYGEIHKPGPQGGFTLDRHGNPITIGWGPVDYEGLEGYTSPFEPGDVVYVRETWAAMRNTPSHNFKGEHLFVDPPFTPREGDLLIYRADQATTPDDVSWRSPLHMPEWASRIKLRITTVRVERLQNISDDDVDSEFLGENYPGDVLPELFPARDIDAYGDMSLQQIYARLWDSINGKRSGRSWADNPWVWRIVFEVAR